MSAPVETLITHAWDLYDQHPTCEYAANLRADVWALEESTDYATDSVKALARQVVHTLAIATGDEIHEILAPMPSVAAWLGLGQ
ncbi:hypothetical protein GTC6_15279 [Gordonia terrae C-6]|uniref:Uncharacterized protein n=1 Tax=Gordonia terrae C-6 TaxID=1316928 RepID=R7Y880_9ACTN|nr:hypothetical protein [Gordonia terrae]EON31984.1 hypothetical protein GTC6_15279 [Gordonia terrae C-6]